MSYTTNLAKAMRETADNAMGKIFEEMYENWGGDVRIDEKIATEIQVPVFTGERLKLLQKRVNALLGRQDEIPLNNVWRVEIGDNDKLKITDFTMPSSSAIMHKTTTLKDSPKFIQDGLAVLQITSDGSLVDGVGKRVSDSVYYILERNDGVDPREESKGCD